MLVCIWCSEQCDEVIPSTLDYIEEIMYIFIQYTKISEIYHELLVLLWLIILPST